MEWPIRFCMTADGVRLAYTAVGQGPALVLHRRDDLNAPFRIRSAECGIVFGALHRWPSGRVCKEAGVGAGTPGDEFGLRRLGCWDEAVAEGVRGLDAVLGADRSVDIGDLALDGRPAEDELGGAGQ